MFKEMRRKDRELSHDTAMEILKNGKFGVMALAGENGYPYGVPLHYVFIDGNICFHSTAQGGYKTECFARNAKASFTVIETKNAIKARSAIVFGTIEMTPELKNEVMEKIIEKFVPRFAWKMAKPGIQPALDSLITYRLKIEHITAKFIDRPQKKK